MTKEKDKKSGDDFFHDELDKAIKKYEDWIFDPKSFDKSITSHRESLISSLLDTCKMYVNKLSSGNSSEN